MRRFFVFVYCAALILGLSSIASADEVAFKQAAFDQGLAAGRPVILDFFASWCPTCRAQKPVVAALMASPRFKAVTLFVADFDTEKKLEQRLHVTQQSTFVVFKNGKEVGRSTGQTREEDLEALFAKAL